MTFLSHLPARLSIGLGILACVGLGAGLLLEPAPAVAKAGGSPYFGRWTVADSDQKFSARGIEYKTIDIAPCGKDFCGVSVSANGKCGRVLFRFFGFRAGGKEMLKGHGAWGTGKQNITIDHYEADDLPGGRSLDLNLGQGYNFNERDGNIPKYYASYKPTGAARCKAG